MGERLRRLTMRSFRGVPGEMSVDFGDGQSIAVYGDNGTGKSTIADALEWFFTGEIELLSHEGRQHAVRNLVGAGDGETWVELQTSGALGGRVVFPDGRGPEELGLASRETFLLRGRTLADFINKTKTEKWKALAEILGLDAIELLRQDLQRVRSDLKKQVKAAAEKVHASRRALSSDEGKVGEDEILATLQQICRGLGVAVPDSLKRVADPSWIAAAAGETVSRPRLTTDTVKAALSELRSPSFDHGAIEAWNAVVSARGRDASRLTLLTHADAYLSSSPSPGEGRCPLCGQTVDGEALASAVKKALAGLLDQSREMERARDRAREGVESLLAATERRRSLHAQALALGVELPDPPGLAPEVPAALGTQAPIDSTAASAFVDAIERWDQTAKSAIETSLPAASDPRPDQLAMLRDLVEQLRAWRAAEGELARSEKALKLAEQVYQAYQDKQKEQLEKTLEDISGRVAEIYEALHPGENLGGITVEPWTAKGVELAVDFHGSRQRPPHGVLSESHLNSLAIALFLAMAQTFNEKLRFLVLDDVINSFDVEHRGQLATLLAEKFDDWQLIVLTHDHQFFEHLWKRAPSWKRIEITSWTYDEGPRTTKYDAGGILGGARERLAQGDANGAATKARRALEELLQEVCEQLQAELPFRRGTKNDRRELGELFKGVRRALKEHAKPMLESLEPLLKNLEADVQATLNVEAHASRGRSGAAEVEAALGRIDQLDSRWWCRECSTRVWHKGTPASSRCKCGKTVFPPTP